MILPRFLLEGIDGNQKIYRRDNLPQDSGIEKFGDIDSFTGTITQNLQDENAKTIHIDNAYKFTTIADRIRKNNIDIWTRLKNGTKIIFTATIIGSLIGIASAIGLGILLPHMLPVALAIGVIALGIFCFSFFSLHRSKQAVGQIKLWADPTKDYIQQCKKHHMQQKLYEPIRATKQLLADQKKQHIEDLKSKVQSFIDQIKANEGFRSTYIHTIGETVKLYLILGTVSRSEAYCILEAYFNEYPELKDLAFGL